MAETADRLERCFSSVFPNLSGQEIRDADIVPLMAIDSLTSVTLLAVIEEEFGTQIEIEALLEMKNFQNIEDYLSKHMGSSPSLEKHTGG